MALLRILIKLIYKVVIGGVIIFLINLVGGILGFHMALNVMSSLIIGFLGVPGIILLITLKTIL
ncbi:MAG TPA: hypothetical protein GX527_09955 [Clostridiaceae bacterium]|nr:hypothetical protein [Clostridiaceae bacterium]